MNYIADAKTKYFRNRAHYMLFKAAWAEAVNNDDIHLKAEHFMFYNALRGKDITSGFTEVGPKKVYHQQWVNLNTYMTRSHLSQVALRRCYYITIDELLAAFGDTVDLDTAQAVINEMPKVEQKFDSSMYSSGCNKKPYDHWKLDYMLKDAPIVSEVA